MLTQILKITILDDNDNDFGIQIKEKLSMIEKNKSNTDLVCNTIEASYKRRALTLNDGTKMNSNSSSVLKYSEIFHPNKTRKEKCFYVECCYNSLIRY